MAYIDDRIDSLIKDCKHRLESNQKFGEVFTEVYLHLRYDGTDCALMCLPNAWNSKCLGSRSLSKYGDFISSFVER